MASITLPPSFPIVGLAVVSAALLNAYQQMLVMRKRKEAGVAYPTLYASEAEAASDIKKKKFNCAQRAHANTLENVPYVLALFGFLSLFHPVFATGSMMTWIFGRIGYTTGYATGDPAKRMAGFSRLQYVGLISLLFGSIYVAGTKSFAQFS